MQNIEIDIQHPYRQADRQTDFIALTGLNRYNRRNDGRNDIVGYAGAAQADNPHRHQLQRRSDKHALRGIPQNHADHRSDNQRLGDELGLRTAAVQSDQFRQQ